MTTTFVTCPLCEATCGLEVTSKGSDVVRIRGDREDPFSRGFICPKGSTLKHLHVDPDRLRAPVVRDGDDWREVSWDEAFAEVERLLMPVLEEHGRESLGLYLGNPNVHTMAGQLYVIPLVFAGGSKNIFSASTVDQMPKHVSSGLMWGDPLSFPLPDIDRTDYLLMLGADPYESNGSLCTAPDFPGRLEAIQARGGKVVVVDPRRSKTAEHADEHIAVVPGTDALLLCGIAHAIFDEGLDEVGRLAPHVTGVDEVREALEEFTPEAVAGPTGVEAGTIRQLARDLAAAPAGVVYGRIGNHTVEFGTLGAWAADVCNVLTGNLDRPGGAMFASPPYTRIPQGEPGGRGFATGRWTSRVKGHPEVRGELPVATLADEIETPGDGQIRAFLSVAGNPVRSCPNSERLDAAFAGLEAYIAVDPYINETTRHADVILPPPSALERSHYDFAFSANAVRRVAKYSPAVFTTDAPDEGEILARLVLLLMGAGLDADTDLVHDQVLDHFVDRELRDETSPIFGRDKDEIVAELTSLAPVERVIDLRLRTGSFGDGFGADPDGLTLTRLREKPHGIDYGPLVERFPAAICTESGKVELAPPSVIDDLERLRDTLARSANGTLRLVGRRQLRSNNSWMHNMSVLVKGEERCTLLVNPVDAAELGLEDGSSALVASRVGKVTVPVEVTGDMMKGVVSLPHGWGHDAPRTRMSVAAAHPGVNTNALTDDGAIDPLSGNAVLNGIPVEVTPARV